jgi:hypothetical protein
MSKKYQHLFGIIFITNPAKLKKTFKKIVFSVNKRIQPESTPFTFSKKEVESNSF